MHELNFSVHTHILLKIYKNKTGGGIPQYLRRCVKTLLLRSMVLRVESVATLLLILSSSAPSQQLVFRYMCEN